MAPTTNNKAAETKISPKEKQKSITAHKSIANHLETAAKFHKEAAKHHEENDNEKAFKSSTTANEHLTLANEAQKEEAKRDALNIKK